MSLENELRAVEEEKARLEARLVSMLEEKKRLDALDSKLEKIFKESGYDTPRQLVDALIAKFSVKLSGRKKAVAVTKRRRTRVTAGLRDQVKAALAEGRSKNSLAKESGISYVVVSKIEKGDYDHL